MCWFCVGLIGLGQGHAGFSLRQPRGWELTGGVKFLGGMGSNGGINDLASPLGVVQGGQTRGNRFIVALVDHTELGEKGQQRSKLDASSPSVSK